MGCSNKIPWAKWLIKIPILFISHNFGSGNTKLKVQADLVSGENPFPKDSCLLSVPSHIVRTKKALWGLFQGHYSHSRGQLWPNPLPRAGLLIVSPWAPGCQHMSWEKRMETFSPQQESSKKNELAKCTRVKEYTPPTQCRITQEMRVSDDPACFNKTPTQNTWFCKKVTDQVSIAYW